MGTCFINHAGICFLSLRQASRFRAHQVPCWLLHELFNAQGNFWGCRLDLNSLLIPTP